MGHEPANQDIIRSKHERIVQLERHLSVARAKVEQLKVRAAMLQREARTTVRAEAALQAQINEIEVELALVKQAPVDEWETASRKLDLMWEKLQTRVDNLANHLQRSTDD